jgi:hypothetical protein
MGNYTQLFDRRNPANVLIPGAAVRQLVISSSKHTWK